MCRQILLLMYFQEDSSVGYMRTRGIDNPNSRIFCKGTGPQRGHVLFQIYVIVPFSMRFIFWPKLTQLMLKHVAFDKLCSLVQCKLPYRVWQWWYFLTCFSISYCFHQIKREGVNLCHCCSFRNFAACVRFLRCAPQTDVHTEHMARLSIVSVCFHV
jgi:hypothetical protein